MSFDGMVTFAMTKELNEALRLSKIEKYISRSRSSFYLIYTQNRGAKNCWYP